MRYLYGPVSSRRLGLSLGVSLTPYKTCSFDCLYCQLGQTTQLTSERKEYIPTGEIIEEIKLWLENHPQEIGNINYLTFSGAGEPTLNSKIGELISQIKGITGIPLAVITNASFLSDPLLRRALLGADLLVPSLDAVSEAVFQKIDRPQKDIELTPIIEGLVALRREFKGKIWLEVMLVAGVNDDLRHIRKLKEVIDRINPDKVQLNSPVRTTACPDILPVEKGKLKKIIEILGEKCEVF